jgi:hypothetical protein
MSSIVPQVVVYLPVVQVTSVRVSPISYLFYFIFIWHLVYNGFGGHNVYLFSSHT